MGLDLQETLTRHGLRQPKRLTLALTGVCNLACTHCWVNAGSTSSPAHVNGPALVRIVREFADLGGDEICFTGGEPLTHPSWLDLMRLARTRGFNNIALQTNAILLKDEDVHTLKELDFPGLSLQVSFDGATAATHDRIRGPGAFRRAMDGIERLVGVGLGSRISLFFTEMSHNLDEFPALLELADRAGIPSVVAGGLVACGRAAGESVAEPAGVEQYVSLLSLYRTDARFRGLYGKMGTMAAVEWLRDGNAPSKCCSFVEHTYITPSGTLYPCVLCHADPYSVSGVFDKSLTHTFMEGIPLWSELLAISRRRADEIEECRSCPERSACAAGCIGRAWGSSGSFMVPDDRCGLRKTIYRLRQDA